VGFSHQCWIVGRISSNDKILIKNLRKSEKWGEFSSKAWFKSDLDSLLRRIDATGIADRKVGSRRQRECQSVSITKVEEIICSNFL